MKGFIIALLCVALLCPVFASCAQPRYIDSLACSDIANALREEILGENEYGIYDDAEVEYLIDSDCYNSSCVMYSLSGDDVGEVGILHADNVKKAEELLEDTSEYIDDLKEEKSDFLRSYLPDELDKLNKASVKRFGNYVVYTILPSDLSEKVFQRVKDMLKA